MTNTQEGQGWAISIAAVAQSTSYDDYLRRMAQAVATLRLGSDDIATTWWHEPARQLWAWHVSSKVDGRWIGNVEFIDGDWVVTTADSWW